MERIFYKHAMKSGKKQFQIYLPQDAVVALKIIDRDELKVTIEKTGISIEKGENKFKKNSSEEVAGEALAKDLDEGEGEFIEKLKEFGEDPTLILKGEVQFGKLRVLELIKISKVK